MNRRRRRILQLARTIESERHVHFFKALLLIRQWVAVHAPDGQTRATVFRRVLRRLRGSAPKHPIPTAEPADDSVDRALRELAATLHSRRGLDRTESLLLVREMLDEVVRSTAAGLVTKCLTPATAAWAITNPRLSPMLASPHFVRAGHEIASGAMPSEVTLDFLSQLGDIMLEESEPT